MVDGGRCGAQGPVARLRDGEVWALMSGHMTWGRDSQTHTHTHGRSCQDTRTWGRDSQTHTHGRRVDTGPNQPCTHTGTDKGLETHRDTWTHMWT